MNQPEFEYECGCESDVPLRECPVHKVPRRHVKWVETKRPVPVARKLHVPNTPDEVLD